jgi:hypothetical protein
VTLSRCRTRVALWALALLTAPGAIHGALAAGDARKSKQAIDRSLAIYVPQNERDTKIFIPQLGAAVSPGKGLEEAALAAGALYFKSAKMFSPQSDAPFNLVLVTHSHWEHKDGNSALSIKYKLLDSAGNTLFEGEKRDDMNTVKLFETNGFLLLSFGIMKDILSDDELLAKAAALPRRLRRARRLPGSTGAFWSIETSPCKPARDSSSMTAAR